MHRALAFLLLTLTAQLTPAVHALDPAHQQQARVAIAAGLDFLRTTQNPDGSWTPQPGPAVTGLVVAVMLDQPHLDATDPVVAKGLEYIMDRVQPDGSIRDGADGILANYNTAICLSALARVNNDPAIALAVQNAQRFLKELQWNVGDTTPQGDTLTAEHPFVGGAGYGRHGRPDMSNTQLMLQGLYDSGVDCDDPAFQSALRFISRCQGIKENTYFPEGTIVNDGGVIYSTSINKDHPDIPVSYADPDAVDEARAGQPVSGLRGYGTMTYAAFKSFLYANLAADDPRVAGALEWIQNNYTLDQNPGLPEAIKLQGLYYYYLTHARALAAYGSTDLVVNTGQPTAIVRAGKDANMAKVAQTMERLQQDGIQEISVSTVRPADDNDNNTFDDSITVVKTDGVHEIDWANALIAKLVTLQHPDGSFTNTEARWMEDDANLVTAYAVTALTEAAN